MGNFALFIKVSLRYLNITKTKIVADKCESNIGVIWKCFHEFEWFRCSSSTLTAKIY